MSSALAVAGVSAVLRDLLNDGIVNHNVSGTIGSSVSVTTLPPDRVIANDGAETSQLNLFLRHVTPNPAWRNEGLPARDGDGRQRLSNPPLGLDLHYLISAYGAADLHAEILLGYAMHLLHEHPVLTRDAIRTALQPSPNVGSTLPSALRALADSGLEQQIEQLRITPEFLDSDELTKFWTATQTHLRPSIGYRVSVVLIQAEDALRAALPVLSRQGVVQPDVASPVPVLDSILTADKQPVAQLGVSVTLGGRHLEGTAAQVVLVNDRLDIERTLAALANDATTIAFEIPLAQATDFPAGIYRIRGRVLKPGEAEPRDTNALEITIAPSIAGLPMTVTRDGAGTAVITLDVAPAVLAGQRAALLLDQEEFLPAPFTTPATVLVFVVPHAPAGTHLARLRVDGIDSAVIDRSVTPPAFLDRRITIQ